MSVQTNLKHLKAKLPDTVTLVAVSKFHPEATILETYQVGQRVFGESRVQELVEKQQHLPSDIEWHFIGHLQTNKVKQVIPFVSLIHSVDSMKLLQTINKEAAAIDRVVPCLLQLHIAQESSKYGFSFDECRELVASGTLLDFRQIAVKGVMGMGTNTADETQTRQEFKLLKSFFDELKTTYFPSDNAFRELSMGMSSDYPIAVQEGSTMVRIGSVLFGEREY